MIDDLVTWLREQIAHDERVAQAAEERGFIGFIGDNKAAYFQDKGFPIAISAHIARQRPRDVLALCAAHTAILDLHPPKPLGQFDREREGFAVECGGCSWECYGDGQDHVEYPCANVKAVALAYQHRPGYREEWRP